MLYASSGVNNLLNLLELAKWVQLLPAAGSARQCGDSKDMQRQRPLRKDTNKENRYFRKSTENEVFATEEIKKVTLKDNSTLVSFQKFRELLPQVHSLLAF